MLLFYLSLIDNDEDKAKLIMIYETYLSWMLKMAFHYLKNEQDAQDAVSDVFLNIVSGNCYIPTDNENDTKAYLFICVRNSALNLKKSNQQHKTFCIDDQFNLSSKSNLEEDALKKDLCDSLFCYIDAMPSIYKDVLTLTISLGKKPKEIAQLLNIPLKTVETRINRGKAILQERFGDII